MTQMPDRVLMTSGASTREGTIDEFLRIPLDAQLEMLMKGNVKFFVGPMQMRTIDALKLLREQRASAASRPPSTH